MILRLGGVLLSVLLHVGLITLLLAWSATDWTRPVFVDLGEGAGSPGSSTADPSPAPAARPAARAAGSAAAPARALATPEPVVPAVSSAPAPAPAPLAAESTPTMPVAPPAPAAPTVTVEPVPAPSVAAGPALPTAPPASSAASGPADARVGATGSGAGAGSGAPSRGDAEQGAGGPGAPPAEYGPYLRRFRQRVQESLIYPLAARRQGLGGTVELHVWLEATGRVRDVEVARSSSHGVLDAAAVETLRRLGPVPFPDSLPRRPLLIRLPLVFELR